MEIPSIEDFIVHQQCPVVDGIVFPNSKIQCLTVSVTWNPSPSFKFELCENSSISELAEKGELEWSDCSILTRKTYEKEYLTILGGEGVWGSDGFVACIDSRSQKTIWIAYFTVSNPFSEVAFENGFVLAKSTLEIWFEFPFHSPHLVRTIERQ